MTSSASLAHPRASWVRPVTGLMAAVLLVGAIILPPIVNPQLARPLARRVRGAVAATPVPYLEGPLVVDVRHIEPVRVTGYPDSALIFINVAEPNTPSHLTAVDIQIRTSDSRLPLTLVPLTHDSAPCQISTDRLTAVCSPPTDSAPFTYILSADLPAGDPAIQPTVTTPQREAPPWTGARYDCSAAVTACAVVQ